MSLYRESAFIELLLCSGSYGLRGYNLYEKANKVSYLTNFSLLSQSYIGLAKKGPHAFQRFYQEIQDNQK